MDIKDFFGSIRHDLIERAVAHHTDLGWIRLYVARWLRAPVQLEDGTLMASTQGTPQGGVMSPLLANIFMYYAFDSWMQRNWPNVAFERFSDDAVVHCQSKGEAESVLIAIRDRLRECGLELHPMKTRIVYCKDDDWPGTRGALNNFQVTGDDYFADLDVCAHILTPETERSSHYFWAFARDFGKSNAYLTEPIVESSSGGGFHPSALTEPYVMLSLHTAITIQPLARRRVAKARRDFDLVAQCVQANA